MKRILIEIEDILIDIEDAILEFQEHSLVQPNFSDDAFRAATSIFMAVLMDKMWNLQENEELEAEDRLNMARKAGQEIRKLIKTYTGIDSHDL